MKITKFYYFLIVKVFALFVFIQDVFDKPKGTNSSAVPLPQGQICPPSGLKVSARGGNNTSAVSPSTIRGSAAASLHSFAAQSQQVASVRAVVKLKCQNCNHLFIKKPELLFYKVKEIMSEIVFKIIQEAFLSLHL